MKKTAVFLAACLVPYIAAAESVEFDALQPGDAPRGWLIAITGSGQPKWEVVADDTAPSKPHVLRQSGEAPKPSFPICLKQRTSLEDGWVEVKFKPVSGKIDQAGGVVWRARDKDNYYVCRANALEDNVVLYDGEGGSAGGVVGFQVVATLIVEPGVPCTYR